MHNALPRIAQTEEPDALRLGVAPQCVDHPPDIRRHLAGAGGGIVIDDPKGQIRGGHLQAAAFQFNKCVVRSFVHQMSIDP